MLGAGIGGLVAARVLADTFDEVTIVERDVMPGGGHGRRGVPQGRHVHGMQAGGLPLLEELFPGLRAELAGDGAHEIADLSRVSLRFAGRLLNQAELPVAPVLSVSRPHLEWRIRERVRRLSGVRVAEGLEAVGVTSTVDGDRARVTGVRVAPAATRDAKERTIDADLVVDATGRGSRMPVWLEQLGCARPDEERVVVHIGYASQTFRLPRDSYPQDLIIEGRAPGRRHGFGAFACEQDRWTFSIMSYGAGERPPTEPEERMRLMHQMAPPWLAEALSAAEPLDDVARHAHPTSHWRHYERLGRLPVGLLAFGDAIAAFNPIYGTGMTVALKQGVALRTALETTTDTELPRRFYRAAARPLSAAWALSTGADLAYPETLGKRTRRGALMGRYVARFLAAAEHDPVLARRFLAVAGLVEAPSALLAPAAVAKVVRSPAPTALSLPERARSDVAHAPRETAAS
ncbi:FAD-dependent monooxygenase [Nocardioides sp. CGMCC 1.13656]|nr:FAD-dependent monooxygenase [Nocardioides sp. CGMCC 1.13656]